MLILSLIIVQQVQLFFSGAGDGATSGTDGSAGSASLLGDGKGVTGTDGSAGSASPFGDGEGVTGTDGSAGSASTFGDGGVVTSGTSSSYAS